MFEYRFCLRKNKLESQLSLKFFVNKYSLLYSTPASKLATGTSVRAERIVKPSVSLDRFSRYQLYPFDKVFFIFPFYSDPVLLVNSLFSIILKNLLYSKKVISFL
jgi:hypothetical protein